MIRKRLKTVAAIACAFTCTLGFAACTKGGDDTTNQPDDTQKPNYQPGETDYGTFEYTLSTDGRGYIVMGMGTVTETNISIPSTYKGLPVIGIADEAFSGRDDLTGIALGNNLEFIGENAFINCSSLTSIRIPAAVKEMGDGAFTNCSGLRTVIFTEVSKLSAIGLNTFQNCTSLATITVPDSVTSIGARAFQNCSSLKTIVIGEGVKIIGNSVFRDCVSLENVTVGSGVLVVETRAFQNCKALKELVLPASITYMGENMLFGCDALRSLTIPFVGEGTRPDEEGETSQPKTDFMHLFGVNGSECPVTDVTILGGGRIDDHAFDYTNIERVKLGSGVTELGYSVFYICYSLNTLIMSNSVTSVGAGSFYATELRTVYFEGTLEQYRRISIGTNNQNLQGATKYYYSEEQPETSGSYWHYVDGEPVVW